MLPLTCGISKLSLKSCLILVDVGPQPTVPPPICLAFFLRHADLPLKHSPLLSPSKEFPCTQVFLSKTDFTDDFRGVWHRILISLLQWIYDTTFLKRLLCHLTINNASSVSCSEVSVSSYLCTAHGAEQAVVSVVVTVDIWTDSLFVAGSLHAKRQ